MFAKLNQSDIDLEFLRRSLSLDKLERLAGMTTYTDPAGETHDVPSFNLIKGEHRMRVDLYPVWTTEKVHKGWFRRLLDGSVELRYHLDEAALRAQLRRAADRLNRLDHSDKIKAGAWAPRTETPRTETPGTDHAILAAAATSIGGGSSNHSDSGCSSSSSGFGGGDFGGGGCGGGGFSGGF